MDFISSYNNCLKFLSARIQSSIRQINDCRILSNVFTALGIVVNAF